MIVVGIKSNGNVGVKHSCGSKRALDLRVIRKCIILYPLTINSILHTNNQDWLWNHEN